MNLQQASSLLAALEANGNALGQLVRDTDGLVFLRVILPRASSDRNCAPSEYSMNVLKACQKLRNVDLCFSTQNEIMDQLQALALMPLRPSNRGSLRTTSTIRNIFFWRDPSSLSVPAVGFAVIFEALGQSPMDTLDGLCFKRVQWRHTEGLDPAAPAFPLPVTSLHLLDAVTSGGSILPFFPRQPSTLQYLSILGYLGVANLDLVALSHVVGNDLRDLQIVYPGTSGTISLSAYATAHEALRLPPSAFQNYPLLTSLDLFKTHGPCLALLETLVKSSPVLADISFGYSRWVCSYHLLSNSPDEIFPEQEIIAELKKFHHLSFIHLGLLPTTDELKYEGMKAELEKSSINVVYQICEEEAD